MCGPAYLSAQASGGSRRSQPSFGIALGSFPGRNATTVSGVWRQPRSRPQMCCLRLDGDAAGERRHTRNRRRMPGVPRADRAAARAAAAGEDAQRPRCGSRSARGAQGRTGAGGGALAEAAARDRARRRRRALEAEVMEEPAQFVATAGCTSRAHGDRFRPPGSQPQRSAARLNAVDRLDFLPISRRRRLERWAPQFSSFVPVRQDPAAANLRPGARARARSARQVLGRGRQPKTRVLPVAPGCRSAAD